MWNENAPLELLKDMPSVLTDENLADIQLVIDKDKYINSSEAGYDLCGSYAPFCKICDKGVSTPCAVAYVRMKIAEGMEVEMENVSPVVPEEVAPVEEEPVAPKKRIRIAVARRKSSQN